MVTDNIIGYDLSAQSGRQIYAYDPVLRQHLPEAFTPANEAEVEWAMQKAISAWRTFRVMEGERRALFLRAIADGIEALDDVLVNRIMAETAYPQARVLVERRRTVAQLRLFADITARHDWKDITIEHPIPGRIPAPKPDLRRMHISIGPVIVFAASNFPLAYSTAGGDTASAFAAGCPVIIKAHESHPGTNALVAEVIMNAAKETGMPDGVFSSLHGDGIITGQLLVKHPLTAAVGFTGSLKGGRALFDLGNQREKPIPVFAEMGSVNPVFLLPEQIKNDDGTLVAKLADSMTMTVGQFCTNPGVIVAIDDEQTSYLISGLANTIAKVPAAPMLNENILDNFKKGLTRVRENIDVVFVSDAGQVEATKAAPGLATVKAETFLVTPELQQEVFGPFSLIVLCNGFQQMLEVAKVIEGQLTSTIHAHESEYAQAKMLMEVLVEKAGRIVFNGVPTGVEVCEAMTHGGPYPACTDSRFTAVGHRAIRRWLRPVTFQDCPVELLPVELRQD